MNDVRREELIAIRNKIEEIKKLLEKPLEEENEYSTSVPAGGKRFNRAVNAANEIEFAIGYCDDAINAITEAVK